MLITRPAPLPAHRARSAPNTAIATVVFARRFRECLALGSDIQTTSKSGLHAKYAVLT
jgi:hypothetical protein